MVQWLRLRSPNAGGLGLIPGQGTRSHMLQLRGVARNINTIFLKSQLLEFETIPCQKAYSGKYKGINVDTEIIEQESSNMMYPMYRGPRTELDTKI